MKYIILRPVKYSPGKYEIEEFETAADAGKFIAEHGLGSCVIAKRMSVEVDICEAPANDL